MNFKIDIGLSFIQCFIAIVISTRPGDSGDYCEGESFEAECSDGSVVLIDRAFYGRMQVSRCIDSEDAECRADVRSHLDRWCSGQRKCSVEVARLIRPAAGICSKDLRSYLEAMYTCVPVLRGHLGRCESPDELTSGYISSYVTAETGCGSLESPWQIRASPGQRINVTLLDFSTVSSSSSSSVSRSPPPLSDVCTVYAIIKELPVGQTATICGGKSRGDAGFISATNSIDVRLIGKRRSGEDDETKFMLRYEVFGCADPTLPRGAVTFNRDAERAVISCLPPQRRHWQLRCNGTEWKPDLTELISRDDFLCDDDEGRSSVSDGKDSGIMIHFQGLSVVIVAAVAAMVGLIILLAGFGYIRRRRRHRKFSDRTCHLGPKGRSPGDGEWLGEGVNDSSKQCTSDTMYLGSQSYVTSRWPPPMGGQGVTATQIASALSPGGVRAPAPEYGTAAGTAAVLRYSEHLYESPNFERKDASLLSASLSRHVDAGTGRQFERDDACAVVQGGRRSITDAVFLAK